MTNVRITDKTHAIYDIFQDDRGRCNPVGKASALLRQLKRKICQFRGAASGKSQKIREAGKQQKKPDSPL